MDSSIGPYQIESELGRGGMGVVYRAQDSRLGRTVAIKALPAELASDPARLERFQREARTLAQLNHPNLAGIYGVEEHNGATYLVLEFVEGETLADRLDRGPLPVDEAIELAEQIAAGVEAAHDAGVIHRDLKPANVIVTPEGHAKVLDFGLARTDEGQSTSSVSEAATMTSPVQHSPTIPGVILGTAAYMSPEQARGRRVDKRTDIWSFGVVLYEMLTGSSPFVGETASDSIGAILHKDFDFESLPPAAPSSVRHVLSRCLARDKNLRYRDIGDVRLDLAVHDRAEEAAQAGASGRVSRILAGVAVCVAVVALAALVVQRSVATPPNASERHGQRFEADLAPQRGIELARVMAPVLISPDSQHVAYLAFSEGENETQLVVRNLETGDERVLRGPENPRAPAWSNDSRSIYYWSRGFVESIEVNGGRPRRHGDTGFSGNRATGGMAIDGRYAYSKIRGRLMLLDPETGESEITFDPIPGREGDWVTAPSFLPDGDHVLFLNQDDVTADSGLFLGSLKEGWSKRLLPFESSGVYIEPNLVLYWREGSLYLQRLDLEARELVGERVRIAESVLRRTWPAFAIFSATPDTLVYLRNEARGDDDGLFVLDLKTGEERSLGVTGSLWSPSVSPSGEQIALDRTVDATAGDIVVVDVATGRETMLSRDETNESLPRWSPDGRWIYFFQGPDLYRVMADGSATPEPIHETPSASLPWAISPDGRYLLFSESEAAADAMALDLVTRETRSIATDPKHAEFPGGFLADGEWLVFSSNKTGEMRIYLTRFDGTAEPIEIERDAATNLVTEGEHVYYITQESIVRRQVTFDESGQPVIGRVERLLSRQGIGNYSVFPGGDRLLLIKKLEPERGGSIRIVRNWIPDSLRPDPAR